MSTHSSILAWRIPWTEEPSGLQSMGSQRVRHSLASKLPPPRVARTSLSSGGVAKVLHASQPKNPKTTKQK